jgi:hypothetical protein
LAVTQKDRDQAAWLAIVPWMRGEAYERKSAMTWEYDTTEKQTTAVGTKEALKPTPPDGKNWELASVAIVGSTRVIYWWRRQVVTSFPSAPPPGDIFTKTWSLDPFTDALLCALGWHRWSKWVKRGLVDHYFYQERYCLLCGLDQERKINRV